MFTNLANELGHRVKLFFLNVIWTSEKPLYLMVNKHIVSRIRFIESIHWMVCWWPIKPLEASFEGFFMIIYSHVLSTISPKNRTKYQAFVLNKSILFSGLFPGQLHFDGPWEILVIPGQWVITYKYHYIPSIYSNYNVGKTIIKHPFGNGNHTTYYYGDLGDGLWNCFYPHEPIYQLVH